MSICRFRVTMLLLVMILWPTRPALLGASESGDLLDQVLVDASAEAAIDRALTWMRSQQQENGGFGDDRLATVHTALVVWSHLAAGITPSDEQHGQVLRKALHFLIDQQSEGDFGKRDGARLYGHAITTIALAGAIGVCEDEPLVERSLQALVDAVGLIEAAARVEKAGDHRGGWRYQAHENQSDLSVSVWQVMALAAARETGLPVADAVMEEGLAYLRRLVGEDGRVGYQKPGEDRPGLRASFVLAERAGARERSGDLRPVLERILAEAPAWQGPWFFIRSATTGLALQRERPDGWRAHLAALRALLIEQQDEEGWWPKPPGDNEGEHGRLYAAAMAVIALSAERGAVPLFQR